MAREDTSSGTEADAGAFEQEREGLVPVICGAPTSPHAECSCVLPLRHVGGCECLHLRDYLRDLARGAV